MNQSESNLELREIFLEKFGKLSLKVEQLTEEISHMNRKFDKMNKFNRSFGLKSLRNSEPLEFAQDIYGIGSPTKKYFLSIRAITEEWKGRKNDILITIRQFDNETSQDLKSLGIRIPINDIRSIQMLTKEVISLLYIASELKNIEINEILRDLLTEINQEGPKMLKEIKEKMNL
ncbi:MAG: hypothetical protein ACFFDK_05295 [Promethearchaeota archaeon]